MSPKIFHYPGMIVCTALNLKHKVSRNPKSWDFLILGKFCAYCRTDLNLVELELPVPELFEIPGHQVVGIIEETVHYIDELKR